MGCNCDWATYPSVRPDQPNRFEKLFIYGYEREPGAYVVWFFTAESGSGWQGVGSTIFWIVGYQPSSDPNGEKCTNWQPIAKGKKEEWGGSNITIIPAGDSVRIKGGIWSNQNFYDFDKIISIQNGIFKGDLTNINPGNWIWSCGPGNNLPANFI